ncbi:hypothetical protein, partial [Streptomyces prasinopilosus]|uniref:hypothetical protein n=1 Tax=Streptomyces prasinopilosus TaxID=67344 RepID=UPI0019CFEECD
MELLAAPGADQAVTDSAAKRPHPPPCSSAALLSRRRSGRTTLPPSSGRSMPGKAVRKPAARSPSMISRSQSE